MADTKMDYEVLHRVRLEDGTLVRPSSEENPLTDEVTTLSLTEEEAQPFLATEAIRPVPTRRRVSANETDETPEGPVAPVSPAPPAPPSGTTEGQTLAEAFGEDTAEILSDNGYTSVDQVRAASDEDLLNIDGIGPKTLEKVRAAEPQG